MKLRVPRSLVLRPGTVLETYPGLGLGNYLYFALQAHLRRRQGRSDWVLDSGLDPQWRVAFPGLRRLLAGQVRAAFRRIEHIPTTFHQAFGIDFTPLQLNDFVAEILLPSRPTTVDSADLVVNVRRGDYYSNPHFRHLYGFDVPAFLSQAVPGALGGTRTGRIVVVSDDTEWCRTSLPWLVDHCEDLQFGPRSAGPVGDFWEVANGRTVVLTNSTFSYWAAYVNQALHGAPDRIWAPAFHQRNLYAGAPWQHDPRWRTLPVDDLPDGSGSK